MPIPAQHSELWERLQRYEFDREPGAPFSFALRVARRNNWTLEYTVRVIEEYRKFIFLTRTTGHMVTPSVWVDEVWHIHLMYTRSYWVRLCHDIFDAPIHHHPGDGSAEDDEKFSAIYERTLQDYSACFGEPPCDIWGHANPRIDWRNIVSKLPPFHRASSNEIGFFRDAGGTAVMPAEHEKLWKQLADFRFDRNPDAPHAFAHRLAKRNAWDADYTKRAIGEYLKFMFLMKITGQSIAPSRWIDEVWHVHLLYTQNYWVEMCQSIFGEAIHHRPGNGSAQELDDNRALYERALLEYERCFGTPPQDIWGLPERADWRKVLIKTPVPPAVKFNVLELFPRPSDEAHP